MGLKLVFEALEIEQLVDEEKKAVEDGPESAAEFQENAVNKAVEESKDASDDASDDASMDPSSDPNPGSEDTSSPASTETEEDQPKDTDDATVDPKEDPDKEPDKEPEDADSTPAQESLRNIDYCVVSMETWGEVGTSTSNVLSTVSDVLTATYRGVSWIAGVLANIGVEYGPTVAKLLYKGVVLGVAKIVDGVGVIYSATYKTIQRRLNSVKNLRKQLAELNVLISEMEKNPATGETNLRPYNNQTIINSLKAGHSVDFVKNLNLLNSFLQHSIQQFHKKILDDISGLQYMVSEFHHGKIRDADQILRVNVSEIGLLPGSIPGYETESDLLQVSHSREMIPGDAVVVAETPRTDLHGIEAYEEAYRDSKVLLGFNKSTFVQVASITHPSIKELKELSSVLGKLIDTYATQQTLYDDILKTKPGVTTSIKGHYVNLVNSVNKVRYKDSLVLPMHLKTTFVAKVYLAGAMDIHDYAAKTIANGLSFGKDMAKKLA